MSRKLCESLDRAPWNSPQDDPGARSPHTVCTLMTRATARKPRVMVGAGTCLAGRRLLTHPSPTSETNPILNLSLHSAHCNLHSECRNILRPEQCPPAFPKQMIQPLVPLTSANVSVLSKTNTYKSGSLVADHFSSASTFYFHGLELSVLKEALELSVLKEAPPSCGLSLIESGPLGAVNLSRHKWPGGLVNKDSERLSESFLIIRHGLGEVQRLLSSWIMSPLV